MSPAHSPVPPEWIRGPADLFAIEAGCYFDEEAGKLVCDFIETFCVPSRSRDRAPLKLLPWQRDFLMRLFGWKRPNGFRRYRTVYLEVAKKNGKSTMLSALVIALAMIDGEPSPEIYLNACTRGQAKIIFKEAKLMVKASAALKKFLTPSDFKSEIECSLNDGVIIANSAEADAKDGLNPSTTIFDELHRQRNRALWAVFEFAGVARDQPLLISITTAGKDESGVWYEQRQKSEDVNLGINPDWAHLGIVYRALRTDDIDDPATWRKANPSMGYTIDEDEFRKELYDAKKNPVVFQGFLRLRLNIIAREEAAFLPLSVWDDPKVSSPILPDSLKGKTCVAGLDLAAIDDLTALVLLFGDDTRGFDALCYFFLPEDKITELEERHNAPYRAWAAAGLIILTPGESLDYGFVREAVKALSKRYRIRLLLTDPAHGDKLAKELSQLDGISVENFVQSALNVNAPTKELQRLVLARKVRHGGHPILRWNCKNAVVVSNSTGLIRLDKKKSREKIDGMSALVNAIAATATPDNTYSVYSTQGVGDW